MGQKEVEKQNSIHKTVVAKNYAKRFEFRKNEANLYCGFFRRLVKKCTFVAYEKGETGMARLFRSMSCILICFGYGYGLQIEEEEKKTEKINNQTVTICVFPSSDF